jgi:hypothetical protein
VSPPTNTLTDGKPFERVEEVKHGAISTFLKELVITHIRFCGNGKQGASK